MPHPAPFTLNNKRFYRNLSRRFAVIILTGSMLASVNAQAGAYPRDEIAFCPSGGPTGWMNFFDKRDREKRWKRYWRYQQHQQARQYGNSHWIYHYPALHQPTWPATSYYTPATSGVHGFPYR
jgi:hypothetical protein